MIVHIGFPKCASTTLQAAFRHSGARFLGCDPTAAPGAFYDERIGTLFEDELRIGGDRRFRAAAGPVRDTLLELDAVDGPPVVLSNENLCHRLTPWDVPTDVKLGRLGTVVPPGATVVVVHRPVRAFLTSLHRNHLGLGYTGSLDDFLTELAVLGDDGTFGDLRLGPLVDLVGDALVDPRIVLVDLDGADAIGRLLDLLGVIGAEAETGAVANAGPDDATAVRLEHANRSAPNRMRLLDWLELHRLRPPGSLDDAELFGSSRRRHERRRSAEAAAPKGGAGHEGDEDDVAPAWPAAVADIESENQIALGRLGSRFDVEVV